MAGVDLGGTKIQAVVTVGGAVVGSARTSTPQNGPDGVIPAMAGVVREAMAEADLADVALVSGGVGSPGAIDTAAGTVSLAANVAGFMDRVELGPRLSALLGGIPITVENDVRAAVIGEHQRGAGRPYADVLGVFVGTGVGGGIILDGRLRRGSGTAGEIGHTTVRAGGRPCGCGRRGCLEAYAGRQSMEREARARVAAGEATELFSIMRKRGRDRLTSGVISRALARSDPMATALIDDAVEALGLAIGSAQNLLDVEAVILGGGLVTKLGDPFVERVAKIVHQQVFGRAPEVMPAQFGDLSGAVGAAVLAGG